MHELLKSRQHWLSAQSAAACMQAILEEAAFKEPREEKKLHLAKAAQERRDAPAPSSKPLQKRRMTDADKKSAYDNGRLDLCHVWQAGKCHRV